MQLHDFRILQFSKIDYIFSCNLRAKSKTRSLNVIYSEISSLKKISIRYYALSQSTFKNNYENLCSGCEYVICIDAHVRLLIPFFAHKNRADTIESKQDEQHGSTFKCNVGIDDISMQNKSKYTFYYKQKIFLNTFEGSLMSSIISINSVMI